jgi:hypothetical protein
MKAKDIRTLNEKLQEQILNSTSVAEHEAGFNSLALSLLSEVAAQFAEANEHLAKIANPLMGYDGPRWAWMTYNGKPFVVDAREVTGIAPMDSGIGNDSPRVVIGMKGQPWSKSADGTVEDVCTKLGIPTEEGK